MTGARNPAGASSSCSSQQIMWSWKVFLRCSLFLFPTPENEEMLSERKKKRAQPGIEPGTPCIFTLGRASGKHPKHVSYY